MGLAESVATSNQSHSLLVIHGHTAEGSADISAGSDWVRHTVGSLRVDIDQTHVGGGQWILKIALVNVLVLLLMLVGIDDTATGNTSLAVRVADIVAQPGSLSTPVDGLICLPLVGTATSEAESLDTHGLEGDYVDVSTKYEFPEDKRCQVSVPLPVSRSKSAQEILFPYFCLMGHNRRRALSRETLSGQLLRGAKRC